MNQRYSALLLSVLLLSCKTTAPVGEIKITQGIRIEESQYPSVVLLAIPAGNGLTGTCTATFVNSRQAITAAHCLSHVNPRKAEIYHVVPEGKGLKRLSRAISFALHPESSRNEVNKYDLAVVTFPLETAPAVSRLINRQPKERDKVVVVGYGDSEFFPNTDPEKAGGGLKRYGKNEIYQFDEEMITVFGVPGRLPDVTKGDYSATAFGDSGGPLFIQEQLAGVTSGGNVVTNENGSEVISNFVDLTHPTSVEFLLSQGIRVPVPYEPK